MSYMWLQKEVIHIMYVDEAALVMQQHTQSKNEVHSEFRTDQGTEQFFPFKPIIISVFISEENVPSLFILFFTDFYFSVDFG